jgi:acyl-CoA thioester hydrolase
MVRVRVADTDLMGIVHHAKYLTYFEVGRVEYLRRRGVSYARCVQEQVYFPVVDLNVRYHKPARFDDRLVVETWTDKLMAYSVRFAYRIQRMGAAGLDTLAQGFTRHGCVDGAGQIRRIPTEIVGRLAGQEILHRPDDQV